MARPITHERRRIPRAVRVEGIPSAATARGHVPPCPRVARAPGSAPARRSAVRGAARHEGRTGTAARSTAEGPLSCGVVRARLVLFALVPSALALAGCGDELGCERDVAARAEAASAPDRRLLGAATDVPADPEFAARIEELLVSQRARRAAAWEVVARVLAPVPLAQPTPLGEVTVPRFRAFYDREDFQRLFSHLYGGLTPEQRAASARFSDAALDDAFGWNARYLDELGTWSEERWAEHVAAFDTPEEINALGGIRRITTSPSLTRHLIESYPEVLRCLAEGPPPAQVEGEARTDRLMRVPIELEACGQASFGPFFVARGASLAAELDAPGARVSILEGASRAEAEPRCEDERRCEVEGPGWLHVIARAEGRRASGALEITRTAVTAPVACLRGALPLDAVSIAAEWRRLDPALPLPTYDTSAPALAALLRDPVPTWGEGQGVAMPGPEAIYTQRTASGATFVLAGFHVRTGELPLGLYVTLWWSDRPDEDFGADRPDAIRALGPPWTSYKMCVAIDHAELDPDPGGGFAEDAPSLAAALAAVNEGRGGPSWCSNPYVDAAPGLARGNCVGCHQHAMTGVRPGEVATDAERFPENGRLAARNNQPAHGFWGLDAGDHLASLIREVVDYWD